MQEAEATKQDMRTATHPDGPATIEVTVHKSHLITIGERLYGEAMELLRELVSNAYDADATEVRITLTPEAVSVEDNGSGMDLDGLRQYFTIGSPEKRLRRRSPIFGRDRIGEFGIGKFASLAAASGFEVGTKRGAFAATVRFDKAAWEQTGDSWQLPLRIEPSDPTQPDGTRVILRGLTRPFDPTEVEQRLIETIPLTAPEFAVCLNGRRLTRRPLTGHHLPFIEGTPYGTIHGELVVVPASFANPAQAGIACRVKQVLVKRLFFGIERWGPVAARMVGEAHADFLPLASDRTDFIQDAPEYLAFRTVMEQVVARLKPAVEQLLDQRERGQTSRVLNDVLERIRQALLRNPQDCPEGLLPLGDEARSQGPPAAVANAPHSSDAARLSATSPASALSARRRKRPQVKRLTPVAVIKRLRLGQQGLSCCVDHLGPDAPECYTEGMVVYLNRDHPLHRRFATQQRVYALYLARLLTQEIALMKSPRNPRQAFARQSALLRDAFVAAEAHSKTHIDK